MASEQRIGKGGSRRGGGSWRKKENVSNPVRDVNNEWRKHISRLNVETGENVLEEVVASLKAMPLQLVSVPANEVEEALLLMAKGFKMMGGAQTDTSSEKQSSVKTWLSYCGVMCNVLPSQQMPFLTSSAFQDLSDLLLGQAEMECGSDGYSKAANESMFALNAVIRSSSSIQIGQDIFERIVAMSVRILRDQGKATSRREGRHICQDARVASPFVICQAALETLDTLLNTTNVDECVVEQFSEALAVCVNLLQVHAGEGCVPIDRLQASRMYNAHIRFLTTLVNLGKGLHVPHVSSIMECIIKFFQFGCVQPGAAFDRSHSGRGLAVSAYTPPHLRRQPSQRSQDSDSASSGGYSGSETSDSDGSFSRGDGDRLKAVRVRIGALTLIQNMAKVNGRSLHQHWLQMLPSRQPLQRSPGTPQLVTVLAYDPHAKVRGAAGATIGILFDGRHQRDFLAVAELHDTRPMGRPFTSLSMSLGNMVAAVHEGLMYSISSEAKLGVLSSTLRALTSLTSAVHYSRMPPDLLTKVVERVRNRWHKVHGSDDAESGVEAALLAALRSSLGVNPPSMHLKSQLMISTRWPYGQTTLSTKVSDFLGGISSGWSLVDELLLSASLGSALVRGEAILAVIGVAENYGDLLSEKWPLISQVLTHNLPNHPLEKSSHEEKAAQNALKLMGALLSDSFQASLIHVCDMRKTTTDLLASVFAQASPVIRCAALGAIGSIGENQISDMEPQVFSRLMELVTDSGINSDVPAIRSAACRSIGTLIVWRTVQKNEDQIQEMAKCVAACLQCKTISVRISASWSLANLCDALSKRTECSESQHRHASILGPAAVVACKDHEKVRANGVRALGHALCLLNVADANSSSWLDEAVSCLDTSLTSGGMKVRWNACYAVGNLMSHEPAVAALTATQKSGLLQLLTKLVADSPNYKVQTQAAAALMAVNARKHFGDVFLSTLASLAHRLDALNQGESGPNLDTGGADPHEATFANFRYCKALCKQLEESIFHLLSLIEQADSANWNECKLGATILPLVGKRVDEVCVVAPVRDECGLEQGSDVVTDQGLLVKAVEGLVRGGVPGSDLLSLKLLGDGGVTS
ncbi:hypothetical protein BSKO_06610 [Bryopsis sp. KO-2023]|nr:hypothetical protein BSKO_06610 [Bryopsis sp. KO-2023]